MSGGVLVKDGLDFQWNLTLAYSMENMQHGRLDPASAHSSPYTVGKLLQLLTD